MTSPHVFIELLASHFEALEWVSLPCGAFFSDTAEASKSIEKLRSSINKQPLICDQPGCERYHLDSSEFISLLYPWLTSPYFLGLCSYVFGGLTPFVKYIRSRNPLQGRGEQSFHSDWYEGHCRERLEVFIALDDVTADNGPLEICNPTGLQPTILTWHAGSMVVIDSTLPHRGTCNRSGFSRQIISVQLGSQLRDEEYHLGYLSDSGDPVYRSIDS